MKETKFLFKEFGLLLLSNFLNRNLVKKATTKLQSSKVTTYAIKHSG